VSDTVVPVLHAHLQMREGRPYPGFRPFRREEWPIFFGRERQVQSLLRLLADHHFICLHGPSGSGKSSLIEAGLIATLEREHRRFETAWCTATFRPGTAPLWNLARGLLLAIRPDGEPDLAAVVEAHSRLVRPGGSVARAARESGLARGANLLLVADQFEELFRFRALGDAGEARRFVDLLLDVFDEQPEGIHLVLATRTDFLGDFSEIVGLAEAANTAPFLTPALTEDELRAAIRGPAELYGGSVEEAMVETMLSESANQPDRLPILQHALMRCWNVASSSGAPGRLTLAVYRSNEIGGVSAALDRHAEEVMNSAELKGLAREVELTFRALAELDGQRRAIRRPLPWAQLLAETGSAAPQETADGSRAVLPLERVVNCFRAENAGFLGRPRPEEKVLKSDTMVDIAHEALIRRWRRMDRAARTTATAPMLDENAPKPGMLLSLARHALPARWQGIGRFARSTGAAPRQRDGWLWDQVDDENFYRALLFDAREEAVINPDHLQPRVEWWARQPRTPAWARRLSGSREAADPDIKGDIARIDELFERSARARVRRRWFNVVIFAAIAVLFIGPPYILLNRADTSRRLAEQQKLLAKQQTLLAEQRQQDIQALDTWKAQLVKANETLAAAAKASPSVAVQEEVAKSENARYAIGYWAFKLSQTRYDQVRDLLEAQGYTIAQTGLLEQRPSWLALQPSVFYYDNASREKAKSIAELLLRKTGVEFTVSRGAGLAIAPGQERWSFRVHYIGQ
jgi:AAA ATPase domain